MDWFRVAAVVSLLVVGLMVGGSAVRLGLAGADRRAAVSIALVGLLLVVAVRVGARSRRWRENPYW